MKNKKCNLCKLEFSPATNELYCDEVCNKIYKEREEIPTKARKVKYKHIVQKEKVRTKCQYCKSFMLRDRNYRKVTCFSCYEMFTRFNNRQRGRGEKTLKFNKTNRKRILEEMALRVMTL